MKVINNLSNVSLLLNQKINFIIYDDSNDIIDEFDMKIPTVSMLYCDTKIQLILGMLNADLKTIENQFSFIANIQSIFDVFEIILKIYGNNKDVNRYIDYLIYFFKEINIPISLIDNKLFINDIELTRDLFDQIIKIILISCELKKEDDFIDDPILKAAKEKINRIKNGNKKQDINNVDFSDTFMILTYEHNYKPEEISNMNIYQLNRILAYTNRCIDYKLSLISTGNAITKKVKFFTSKEKNNG